MAQFIELQLKPTGNEKARRVFLNVDLIECITTAAIVGCCKIFMVGNMEESYYVAQSQKAVIGRIEANENYIQGEPWETL